MQNVYCGDYLFRSRIYNDEHLMVMTILAEQKKMSDSTNATEKGIHLFTNESKPQLK